VTVATFLIGYPVAYYIVRNVRSRLLRSLLYIVVVTPLFTSNIVRAFGWMVMLGRRGLVNDMLLATGATERPISMLYGQSSIVIGLTYIMAPFMVLTVASVLQNIDRSLDEAARDLGAGAWSAFWRVTFPLSRPGVIAGALIVFTLSVSAYVTPSILSGGRQNVTSMLIFQQYGALLNFEFGAALSVVLLFTTLVLVGAFILTLDRGRRAAAG
jgi:putative spermidine/putrescine transport system permease protein